jgi:Carboxypeptidase regulatory-like domain
MLVKRVIRLFMLVVVLLPAVAIAQVGTATVLGNVMDGSGSPISGASVVIENSATGIRRDFVTGDTGSFEFPYLSPGIYQVTATTPSFETKVVRNFSVEVEQRARLDITLTPGQVKQEVQVSATASLVNTDSATVGQVINNQQVEAMPLNGRDWISLAFLAPGVIKGTGTNADFFDQGGSVSVNGGRVQNNNYTIDGTDNNDLLFGGFAMNLSVEAIQEFKIQNDLYTAEYGRSGGGQVNLVTKSGSNQFHGDAFEFLRNSYFDARNFFALTQPSLRRNQFGGTLGGPIKKDRVFFFLDYEGERLAQGVTQTTTTPTAALRQGMFGPTEVIDPNTNTPFPNNTIPTSRINPIASQILSKYYPQQNIADAAINNYTSTFNSTENDNQFTARVDWKLTGKDTIYGRVSHAIVDRFAPSVFNQFGNGTDIHPTSATVDNIYIFSPRQINEFRVGVNRPIGGAYFNEVFGTDLITPLGIQGITPVVDPQYVGFPDLAIAGYATVGVSYFAPVLDFPTFYDLLDDHTYIKGRHSVKAGIEIKDSHQWNETGDGINGELSFSPTFTGNALGDFLLGLPTVTEIGVGNTREYLQAIGQYYYLMDDWRITDRLTLNLGVRYEYNPPWVEKQNRLADVSQAANGTLTPLVAGVNGVSRSIVRPDRHDVAPRFGFAYQPSRINDFVIRGGYGIFYNQVITNVPFLLRENPPFYATRLLTSVVGGQLMSLQNPFPPGVGAVSGFSNYVDPNIRDAYIGQWSLNIEKQFPWDVGVEIGYIGSKGTKMPMAIAENQAFLGPGPIQSRRPDPDYTQLVGQVSSGGSSYNAFQAKLEKRMSQGIDMLLGYTFGKSLDTESSTQSNNPQNSYNLAAEWGPSDYNRQQSFTASYVWNLPFGEGQHWLQSPGLVSRIVSGWSTTGIVTAQTGFPLTVGLSGNISSSGVGADRPNRIGYGGVSSSQRTIQHWLDPTAFSLPPAYTFGNSGRNILTGPGYVNWDLGIMKMVPLFRGRQTLQLRFEAFNSLNHPQFSNPASDWNLATFGTITSADDPRILQFATKYIF